MAYNPINVGSVANDGTGDTLRSAGQKINARFAELGDFLVNGPVAAPNTVANVYAVTHADLEGSNILGGTQTQPNLVGQKQHVQTFTGDGSTTSFSVTAPFTITDLSPAPTVIATGIRASDGVPLVLTVSGVTGYGTTTLNMTIQNGASALASGDFIEVVVLSNEDDPGADPTLVTTSGYNNSVNPIMSAAFGAHGLIANGGGHDVIAGGSYGRIYGSYCGILAGQGIYIGFRDAAGTIGSFAGGRGIRLDGLDSAAFGLGHDVAGDFCFYSGTLHRNNDIPRVSITGCRGQARTDGERIHAGGKANDTDFGLYQVRELVLAGNTTDATVTGLSNAGSISTQAMPTKSAAMLRVEVAGIKDDSTKMASFAGDFLFTVDSAGTARINNSVSDVAVAAVSNVGSPTWTVAARAISGGLLIRVTGAVGENVRWVANARMTQTRYP